MILRAAKEIGVLIRERRRQLKFSQAELAKKVGVSRLWLVQVEQGKPSAQLGLILRTLREVGITLHADAERREIAPIMGGINLLGEIVKKAGMGESLKKVRLGESLKKTRGITKNRNEQ